MTSAERLQPYIVAAHRRVIGMGNDSAAHDPLIAMADPELLAYAREEIARLRKPGNRTLAEHDHESKIRCQTLERMVAAYEETQEKA